MKFGSSKRSIHYAIAVLAAALAIAIRVLLTPMLGLKLPLITFYPAIALSAWFGGLWPGLVTTLACALAGAYLWFEPGHTLWLANSWEVLGLALFLGIGLIISGLTEALHRARRQLEAQAASLAGEIEERAHAEAAVRASEERYRAVAETAPDAIITIDEDSRILFVNPAVERIFGYSVEEVLDQPLTLLMPESLRPVHRAAVGHYLETGHRRIPWRGVELTGLHKSGREVPLEISFAETFRDGRRTFIGFVRDITERHKAEAALRASEARHRRLFEANIIGMAISDSRGRIWEANEAFLEMAGFTREEVQAGKARWDERTPPEYQEVSWQMVKQLQRSGVCPPFEKEYVHPDGRRVSVVMAGAALEGSDQHIAFALDISHRKRAEGALRASEARLGGILGSAMDAIISVDGAQRILLFNRAAEQMFRCSAQEAIGRPIDRFIPERFRTAHRSHIEVFGRTGVTTRSMRSPGELVGLRADGEEFPIEATISQVETVREKIYTVILRDVTERKRAEEARGRLAAIAESSGDAIIGETLDAIVHSWNPAAERLYGYTAQEAIGREISFIYPPDRAGERIGFFQQVMKGKTLYLETARVRKDGTLVDISLTLSPVRDTDGSITGISHISRDITVRKQADVERARLLAETERARADAEAANRAKDEFLAILSHELRAPLNSILMWAQVLRGGGLDEATAARALESIERQTKAQAQLIADLLDISRIIAGKLPLDLRRLELAPVVEAALEVVRPTALAKELRLEAALEAGVWVTGDPPRLQQVVWNLLVNAAKFTPAGGQIAVTLAATEAQARIVVRDNGQGISPDFLPYAFDRFRQADASPSRAYAGLGLGLAVVRHLVEGHGGTVCAESAGEGQGATFTVTLPRIQAIAPSAVEPETRGRAALPSLEGIRVLVVDDEADARMAIATALGRCGAQVDVAASAAEALAGLDRTPPHVLVSDIGMPEQDGYALIRQVRARAAAAGAKVPAVALTAYASREDAERALASGYQAHLSKPADVQRLAELVADLAGRPTAAGAMQG